ncbi:hypothetical protein AB0F91_41655 [Amycolatopsis sp. NPDC023774]|uniref:hypothetical protein n=1 Tax=Amycolatopsis sp. NPDC023774 TaxID=3155015 RepID=UPI0033DCB371
MRKVLLVGVALLVSACSTSQAHSGDRDDCLRPVSTPPAAVSSTPFAPPDMSEFVPTEDAMKPFGLAWHRDPVPWVMSANAPMKLVWWCGRDQPPEA